MVLPGLLLGAALAIAMAYIYQLLLDWIPFIYISILLTIGAGIALSVIASTICSMGHCRNRLMGFMVGLLLAACFLNAKFWFQYQSSIPEMRKYVALTLLESDDVTKEQADQLANAYIEQEYHLSTHLKMRVENGWQLGRAGAPVSDYFVYLVWIIEAGIIAFLSIAGALAQTASPYSEKMSQWASEEEHIMDLPITDEQMVVQINQATTVEQLLQIPIPRTDESDTFAVYKTNSIPGEELEDAYLTVDLVQISVNAKGEEERREMPLVKHAILTADNRKELIENASLLQEALVDYRQAVIDEEIEARTADEMESQARKQP